MANELKTTNLAIQPGFELEDFMNLSKETRIDSQTLALLTRQWEQWAALAKAVQITSGKKNWLAVWLPQEVEQAVDEAWQKSPSQGYLLNNLALYISMSIVQDLVPQAADGGCAPAPRPDADLRRGLTQFDITETDGALKRRYAVVTYFPFKGGCEICALQESCPKGGNAGDSFASVLLPGYERP